MQCSRTINLTITAVRACVSVYLRVHLHACSTHTQVISALSMWDKGTHTLSQMWMNTQEPFGQIGVLFCHPSPESRFTSIQSLWSKGFLRAVLPEVKVIRLGMISGLLDLPFLLLSPSPPFKSPNPNCLFKSKNTRLPLVNVGIFFYFFSFHSPWPPTHQSIRNWQRYSIYRQSVKHLAYFSQILPTDVYLGVCFYVF